MKYVLMLFFIGACGAAFFLTTVSDREESDKNGQAVARFINELCARPAIKRRGFIMHLRGATIVCKRH